MSVHCDRYLVCQLVGELTDTNMVAYLLENLVVQRNISNFKIIQFSVTDLIIFNSIQYNVNALHSIDWDKWNIPVCILSVGICETL